MNESAWRTVVIDADSRLSFNANCLVIERDGDTAEIPLPQIRVLMLTSRRIVLTGVLLNELLRNEVRLIICDEKQTPAGELINYRANVQTAGRIAEQISWSQEHKEQMWQYIVVAKIAMQSQLLERLQLPEERLVKYASAVRPGDPDNREGQASRIYFHRLFGKKFTRDKEIPINSALNYGYAILRSTFDRAIAGYGFHSAIGIKHCNAFNHFNLSCDLMEPFRPFVDEVVYLQGKRPFDREFKRLLIALPETRIKFKKRSVTLAMGVELFARSTLRNMKDLKHFPGRMDFA
ncbi:MAG: type II CRISPR-associated endonuclease Cas1 [Victivallales bacterium]|jgi:CRISPR-associated endonuclease Cas1 subtype II|nr:type II CRISPR-associated endonuclease Cas1 [Victivallales bacterium]